MPLRKFTIVKTSDQDLQLVQQNVKATLDALTSNPANNALLKPRIALTAGPNLISHGLGRNYVSYFVGRPSTTATVIEGTSPDPSKFVVLTASAPVTIDLLVM